MDLQHDLEIKSEAAAKEAARAGKKVFAFVVHGGSEFLGDTAKGAVNAVTFAPKCLITGICDSLSNKKQHKGKQTMKQLVGSGAKLEDIPITAENIGDFKATARKHGIDYSLKKVVSQDDNGDKAMSYVVFFKAKTLMC